MTKKRFKQVVGGVKDTRTGRTLTHPLEFTLKLNEINGLYDCVFNRNEELEKENEQLKQQVEDLEFQLRTIKAYDRTVKEEHSDSVYDFQKKLEKW